LRSDLVDDTHGRTLGERELRLSVRFSNYQVTNQASRVVLILMDNDAFDEFHQVRGEPWDRSLHARLLNRLADDGCSLVVFDSFFRIPRDPDNDKALAEAMRRQRHLLLMAEQAQVTHPTLEGARPTLPAELFLAAAAPIGASPGWIPISTPSCAVTGRSRSRPYPSLAWTAAQLAGARLDFDSEERWLRYYGQNGDWTA